MKFIFPIFVFIFSIDCLAEMKGWELYCLQDKSEVKYALLPGTNRLKSESEIIQSQELVPLSGLSRKLQKVPKGEPITIQGGGVKAEGSKLVLPPDKDKQEILSLCRSLKLQCLLTQ